MQISSTGRAKYGPNRLLVHLLYRSLLDPNLEVLGNGRLEIKSVRNLARSLGVDSKRVNKWLAWLEFQQLVSGLAYSTNCRTVQLYIRKPILDVWKST